MKTRKPVARKVGPVTSRRAAARSRFYSANATEVFAKIRDIGPCTCEQVILALKEDLEPGMTLREDPISGLFNSLHLSGKIAVTGEKALNTSRKDAMLYRVTTREERRFLKAYVGPDSKAPWPSGDTILEHEAVRRAIKAIEDPRVRKLFRLYMKGVRFKTIYKDIGIKEFMKFFDENGRKRK